MAGDDFGLEAELTAALSDGYDLASLQRMTAFGLKRRLDHLVNMNASFEAVCFDLVRAASMGGWLHRLCSVAAEANNGNEKLAKLAWKVGAGADASQQNELEAIIRSRSKFQDVAEFALKLLRLQGQVGLLEYDTGEGACCGTGFLIGPDLLLTNFHVVDLALGAQLSGGKVEVVFDRLLDADGMPTAGRRVPLAEDDWCVAYSPSGFGSEPSAPLRTHLDFALLRLSQPVGDQAATANIGASSRARGWIDITDAKDPEPGDVLLVLQHPAGRPQKLSIGTVLAGGETVFRIRHNANTLPGSSGSPCFSSDLSLVALHHASEGGAAPSYNQAISLEAIRAALGGAA